MKVVDALAGVTRLGIDTAPFIYFIERHPRYVDTVRSAIALVSRNLLHGYTSVLTLTELLTQPRRAGNAPLEARYRAFLRRGLNLTLLAIDADIAERAAEPRARYRLRTPDALQLAAALSAGCQALLTNDRDLSRVTELRVLTLDELEP